MFQVVPLPQSRLTIDIIELVFRDSDTQWSEEASRGFEMILSYSFKTRITSGYVRGTRHAEIGQILQQLATCSASTAHPLLLPTLVVCRELGSKNDEFHQRTRQLICTFETKLGDRYRTYIVCDHPNTEQILRDISGCQYRVSQRRPEAWLKVIDKLTQAMKQYWESLTQKDKTPELEQLHETLLGRLDFFTSKFEALEIYVKASEERLKNLQQVVSHELAIRLRVLSILIKPKVNNIVAYQESQANVDMIAQHHHIARMTKDDSVVIRSVSLLTMIFLPGTFVATLFSTSFFDFTNGQYFHATIQSSGLLKLRCAGGIGRVSNHIWVYFAVVVPLTILVIGAWWGYGQVRNKTVALEGEEDNTCRDNLGSSIIRGLRHRKMPSMAEKAWDNIV
jgi:hypothetical protein